MKTTVRSIVRIAGTLLALFAFASASFAANPLSYPWGLAWNGRKWKLNSDLLVLSIYRAGLLKILSTTPPKLS